MKKFCSKLVSLLLCAAALFSFCAPYAAADDYWVNAQPVLNITRKDMDPIQPGQEFTLTVSMSYTNAYVTVQSPRVTFAPSSAFMVVDPTPTKALSDFKRNQTVTASIKLKAMNEITSPVQSVGVTVSFSYDSGSAGLAAASCVETIYIPVETSAEVVSGAPVAVITRGAAAVVSANEEFALQITVKNDGKSAMIQPMLSVSPDSDLVLMDAAQTRQLSDIQPGGSVTVPVQLKARDSISSPSLSVALDLKYSYPGGSDSASQTVYVPAVVTEKKEDPAPSGWTFATPNIILSQYHYGNADSGEVLSVAAGSTFDLDFEFENTSSIFTVENIVVTVSPGEGFCIASGSDTAHYPKLAAGAAQAQTVSIQAQPTAKTGAAKIDVRFSYEYVENSIRKNVNLSQTISIPVYQPDRFEVEMQNLPEFVSAYEEMYIQLPYVNKGKSEVSNVRAEIISEDGAVTSINAVQNLGNFAAGQSGTIDFIFSPQMPGEVQFSFRITYEDPNAQEKVLDFPVTLQVEEPYYPGMDDPGMYDPGFIDEPVEQSAGIPWWAWAGGGAVLLAAVIVTVALVKKKKKAASGELSDFVWEDSGTDLDEVGGKK